MRSSAPRIQKAAALEDQLAYMEPPYWYCPVRQSLGDAKGASATEQLLSEMWAAIEGS
jgi:hypothetical protein